MAKRSVDGFVGYMGSAALLATALSAPVGAQVTTRVSLDPGGAQANGTSYQCSMSADARYVAFISTAMNLVPGDVNGYQDVFVRDRYSGAVERASVASGGAEANFASYSCSISADSRYVAFQSNATNLVPGDTNGSIDVFVHDRQSGATERVSVDSAGVQANDSPGIYPPAISADGRFVAFYGFASNLVPGDTNGVGDVFVRDRQLGTTERVSVASGGAQANNDNIYASLAADGRYVAFFSFASNLVTGDTNAVYDVFVRDRQSGTTERVSLDSSSAQVNGSSSYPSISGDGRYVAFLSSATNLVSGDTNGAYDVFVRDRQNGTTERASVDSGGAQANGGGVNTELAISADGRCVAFTSPATNLVPGDTNGVSDLFVRDRQSATTARASVDSSGVEGNAESNSPSLSADGRFAAFVSTASNLVTGDTNAASDVFLRDRDASNFPSSCDPGVAGVIACPCGNPPSGPGRGCNNSASTGGAVLAATGIPYFSMDSVVFTTSGEKPVATSIVLQGTTFVPAGLIYGQGVRCVGGALKRLYTKAASGGSITAPDFGAGDPSVHSRSAALGDAIPAGSTRWYTVYYRDPIVLGGCPATSTFNCTQTRAIPWLP